MRTSVALAVCLGWSAMATATDAVAAAEAAELAASELAALLAVEVEAASRHAQSLFDAPAAVSVLPAEDLARYGFRSLGEALASLRGVQMVDEYDYQYLGVRGLMRPGDYNTRVLLMQDGVRRNDPLYDTAAIGSEAPIELDWIKQLEFIPGPVSALYGSNGLFGIANAVLFSGSEIDGIRPSLTVGSGGLMRAGLLAGRATGGCAPASMPRRAAASLART